MLLPKGAHAFVDETKLRDYCLNTAHARGKHKARVFRSRLNLGRDDAPTLRSALLEAARSEECRLGRQDAFGQRYILDFEMTVGDNRGRIRSIWIIRTGEDDPRLVTCFVL